MWLKGNTERTKEKVNKTKKILNFITKHKLYLSEDDLHPNAEGHKRLANNIMEKINGVL